MLNALAISENVNKGIGVQFSKNCNYYGAKSMFVNIRKGTPANLEIINLKSC